MIELTLFTYPPGTTWNDCPSWENYTCESGDVQSGSTKKTATVSWTFKNQPILQAWRCGQSLLWIQLKDKSMQHPPFKTLRQSSSTPLTKGKVLFVLGILTTGGRQQERNLEGKTSLLPWASSFVCSGLCSCLKTMEHSYTKIGTQCCQCECQPVVCCINTN